MKVGARSNCIFWVTFY